MQPVQYARITIQLANSTALCEGSAELFQLAVASASSAGDSIVIRGSTSASGSPVLSIWLLLEADDQLPNDKVAAFTAWVSSSDFLARAENVTGFPAIVVAPLTSGAVAPRPPLPSPSSSPSGAPSTDDQLVPSASSTPVPAAASPTSSPGPVINSFRTECSEPDMMANYPLTVIDAIEGADWNMPGVSTWFGLISDPVLSSTSSKTFISGYQLSPNGELTFPGALTATESALDIQTQAVVPASDTTSGKEIVVGVSNSKKAAVLGKFGDDGNIVYDDENTFDLSGGATGNQGNAEIVYLGDGKVAISTALGGTSWSLWVLKVNADEQLELVQDLASSVIQPQKLILDANNKLHFKSGSEPQLFNRLDFDGSSYSVAPIAGSERFIPALLWQGAIYGEGGNETDLFKYTEADGLEFVAEMTPAADGDTEAVPRVMPAGACGDKLFVTYNDVPPGIGLSGYHVYNDIAVIYANGTRGADIQQVSGQDVRGARSPYTAACAEGFLYIHNGWGPALRIDARSDTPSIATITAFSDVWPSGPSSATHIYAEPPGVGANSGNAETRVYMHMEDITNPLYQDLWIHFQHSAVEAQLQAEVPNVPASASGAGGRPINVCEIGPDFTVAVYEYVGDYSSRSLQIRQIHSNQTTTLLAEGSYTADGATHPLDMVCVYSATGDGTVYFPFWSKTDSFGRELYSWQPGMTLPSLVVDAEAGAASANPAHLTLVDNRLFFASDGGRTLMLELPGNTTSVVSPTYTDASEDTAADEMIGVQASNGDWRAFALVPVEGTPTYQRACQLMTMGPSDAALQAVAGVAEMNCPRAAYPPVNLMVVHEGSLYVGFDDSSVAVGAPTRGLLRVDPDDLSSELLAHTISGLAEPRSLISATERLYFVGGSPYEAEVGFLDTSVAIPSGADVHQLTDLSVSGYSATIGNLGVDTDGSLFSCISRSSSADQFTVIEPIQGNWTELGGYTAGCAWGDYMCSGAFTTKAGDTNYVVLDTGVYGKEVLIYPPVASG